MPTHRRASLALGALALASCTPSVNMEAERALLRQADEWYTATANAGDVDGLTALYAEDATRYSPSGESTTGIDGDPVIQQLRDFHLWRKEADGVWRIVEDIWQVLGD